MRWPRALDGRWLTLDNRRMGWIEMPTSKIFPAGTFVIGQHGVMRYADGSLLADTSATSCGFVRRGSLAAQPTAAWTRRLTNDAVPIVAWRRPTTICFPCLILPSVTDDVALQPVYSLHWSGRNMARQNFLFFISHPALMTRSFSPA